jgi:hypothetical protein
MGRTCSTHGRGEKFIQISIRKSEEERPLERPKLRWEDDIKVYIK